MKLIKLANGETLNLAINFLTIKLVIESGIMQKLEKISKAEKLRKEEAKLKGLELSEKELQSNPEDSVESIKLTGKLLWAIMYSNGKKITEEDALALIPLEEEDSFWEIIDEFTEKSKEFAKKAEARSNLARLAR
jgi:antitoxin component YwqK of YwqJK toxin-antitoxin module